MKQNNITDKLFETTTTIGRVSRTGNLYGRILELQDVIINAQKRINELQTELDEVAHD
jgi:hypothetical protein|tara:strand:- start:792 stop:965 length:174 start_codon:yes stop_codon:yes gene_type:complete